MSQTPQVRSDVGSKAFEVNCTHACYFQSKISGKREIGRDGHLSHLVNHIHLQKYIVI